MKARMWTGLIICLVLMTFIYFLRQFSVYILDGLIFFFVFGGCIEMCKAYKSAGLKPMSVIASGSAVLTIILFYLLKEEGIVVGLIVSAIAALVLFTIKHTYSLNDLAATLSVMLYPQLFMSLFYILNHCNHGLIAVTIVLAVSICTDSCALFGGKLFGKRKLCPQISPKKTIAGAVSGVIGGVIGSLIPFLLFDVFGVFNNMPNAGLAKLSDNLWISAALYIVLGIIGGAADEIGDLVASWIKRNAGIKDFSKIFPGHGGIMDRLDGIMFTLAAVYVFFVIFNRVIAG